MDDGNLSRFIEVAKRFGLQPVAPVSIDALRNPVQIEQWHREKGMLAFALRLLDIAALEKIKLGADPNA